jgi:acetolactate synthase I/II/III large subunit
MAKITGGQMVGRFLAREGIKALFTLSGGHIMDIYAGCTEEGIRVVDVRHEQSAVHAADAWTRLTGVTGVAAVTAGPGVTDGVTGVANAFRAQIPMLLIGGQAPLRGILKGGLQEINHVDIMKPITKFSATVFDTERIPEYMSIALREAYNGRPGPSFLEIPTDVLEGAVEESAVRFPESYRSRGRIRGDASLIELAAGFLEDATRPVILAGTQVWHCRAFGQLNAFVKKTGIPVYLNGAARGSLSPGSEHLFARSRRTALSKADVVMIVGTPFDFRLGYGNRIAQGAKIIQIDLDYAELCHNRDVDVPICADAGSALEDLRSAVRGRINCSDWRTELRAEENKGLEKDMPFLLSDEVPIHPMRLAREINEFMGDDGIFIADGGDVVTMSANAIRTRKPGKWLDPGPLGTLGVGTPFAIAAKTAFPDTEVTVLFGDGAFGCTGMDFDTLVRFDMPVIGIVGNNAAWNQVRFAQLLKYGPERGRVANELTPLRYDRLIEVMGGYGENVTEPSQIRPALERARASRKPACINVMVARDIFSSSTKSMSIYS